MTLPRSLAKFASHRFNPVGGRLLLRLPGFAEIVHSGRQSGATYRTPIVAFEHKGTFVFALTYGPTTDWVQNVLAARTCTLVRRGQSEPLNNPRLIHDPARTWLPRAVRPLLRLLRVDHVLLMDRAAVTAQAGRSAASASKTS